MNTVFEPYENQPVANPIPLLDPVTMATLDIFCLFLLKLKYEMCT